MERPLRVAYKKLYARFGPQHWWPGRSPFEVMVGAILTQNTSWKNVEKAIARLREEGCLSPAALYRLRQPRLAELLRPAGYYNIKAVRLRNYTRFYLEEFGGSPARMAREDLSRLRGRLLAVNGIGEETADSILLYALGKPVFVVDAYTKRIFSRHGFFPADSDYARVQAAFTGALGRDARLFNEYHALIVRLGKDHCRKTRPRCEGCPLNGGKPPFSFTGPSVIIPL